MSSPSAAAFAFGSSITHSIGCPGRPGLATRTASWPGRRVAGGRRHRRSGIGWVRTGGFFRGTRAALRIVNLRSLVGAAGDA